MRPISVEEAHDVHALRVPEASVELDHLDTVRRGEEPTVHDTREPTAHLTESLDHALNNRTGLPILLVSQKGQRRIGQRERTHPAGSRALVAVVAKRIVVGGRGKDGRLAVTDRLDRELGADDLLLDQY